MMKFSQLAFKPLKNPPADATTINHALLVQAGYVRQLMAGVYTYTPLGLRVLTKIQNIIRRQMDAIGGQEILMPMLHPKKNWQTTGGWDSIDVLFKLTSRTGREYALGQSHEEIVTPLAKELINSYRDLPLALYQIHWKFRDELRAKSGILRGREFQMKDMYSWHADQADFDRFYQIVKQAYIRAFNQVGLTAKATEASGGNFTSKISYEFMVLTDAGEDDIFYCPDCDYCVNQEIAKIKAGDHCPHCKAGVLQAARAAEVGNVFDLGTKYCQDFGISFTDAQGQKHLPIMGCYGWGTTRTMGVVVEKFHDQHGIIWPASIAPYQVYLINLDQPADQAQQIVDQLTTAGIEVLWDDRAERPGVKFTTADLLGIPSRVVLASKNGGQLEFKRRDSQDCQIMPIDQVISQITKLTSQLI